MSEVRFTIQTESVLTRLWNFLQGMLPFLTKSPEADERPSETLSAEGEELQKRIDEIEPDDEQDDPVQDTKSNYALFKFYAKISILLCFWLGATILMMIAHKPPDSSGMVIVPQKETAFFDVKHLPKQNLFAVDIHGPFDPEPIDALYSFKQGVEEKLLTVQMKNVLLDDQNAVKETKDLSGIWKLALVKSADFDMAKVIQRSRIFDITGDPKDSDGWVFRMHFTSSGTDSPLPLLVRCKSLPITATAGFVFGILMIIFLLLLIGFDILNRTFAIMFTTTVTIAIVGVMGLRADLEIIVSWMNTDILLLLFSVMVLIAVCMQSGIFDYLAVLSFETFNGHIWPPLNIIIAISLLCAIFINKIAMILIIGPLCLRLCEVMNMHPAPSLLIVIFFINVGDTTILFNDPGTLRNISDPELFDTEITTIKFFLHMIPGILLVICQTYVQLRYHFRNIRKIQFRFSPEASRLRRRIIAWKRAAMGVSNYSKDEQAVRTAVVSKIKRLRRKLAAMAKIDKPADNFSETLAQLKTSYRIRDKALLIKSIVAFVFVMVFFALHMIPTLRHLSLGWSSLMGAILILVLADMEEMEDILALVQWCSLLFIATNSAFNQIIYEVGFLRFIGEQMERTIAETNPDHRLLVAIVCFIWISGFLSAVLETKLVAPFMVRASITLATKNLVPWHPLLYAIAFGCGLGDNGTLIASPTNIVGIGLAEQHGYSFYFWYFLKIGVPLMLGNLLMATIYMILICVIGEWY